MCYTELVQIYYRCYC